MDKGIGHCALPRPGSSSCFVELQCRASFVSQQPLLAMQPPRCALCAASLLPPLRLPCPTCPLPLLAAPRNWSGSGALKYHQGTGMLVWFLLPEWQGNKMEGRESTEGVGGGLTSRVRGWRKIRQQKKGKEVWEMGREQKNSSSGKKLEHE